MNNSLSLTQPMACTIGLLLMGSSFSTLQAGSWSAPVYTVTGRVPADTTHPDADKQPIGGGGGIAPSSPSWVAANSGPVASGTVYATFTYIPSMAGDLPPAQVVVLESASASWSTLGTAPGGGGGGVLGRGSVHNTAFPSSKRPQLRLAQVTPPINPPTNGFGDPAVAFGNGSISSGWRLKAYSVSGNHLQTDATSLSAQCAETSPETLWSYSAQIPSLSPNPYGLALPPYPNPLPQKPLNQYVMSGMANGTSTSPFVIPCSLGYSGGDAKLVQSMDWELDRYPSTLWTRVLNGDVSTSGSAFPQHIKYPGSPPTPAPGLAMFDLLPASNSAFGIHTATHKFKGQTVITAPLAVFYEANLSTHPLGAYKWCDTVPGNHFHLQDDFSPYSPIPNWFYYYSQTWTPPCPIAFGTTGAYNSSPPDIETSFWDPDHPDHIHLNNNVSGVRERPIYETRPNRNNGFRIEVGTQKRYGIDSFVTAIEHEYAHKFLAEFWENVQWVDADLNGNNDGDNDGDNVPDWIEIQYGLNPEDPDTSGMGFGDNEVYCKIVEQNSAGGPRASDWASNGLNSPSGPGQSNDPAIRRPITWIEV